MSSVTQKFRKGSHVLYRAHHTNNISAIVRTAHRDGSFTVEACFVLDESGNPAPGYLGYRYRMRAEDLRGRP